MDRAPSPCLLFTTARAHMHAVPDIHSCNDFLVRGVRHYSARGRSGFSVDIYIEWNLVILNLHLFFVDESMIQDTSPVDG